MVRPKKLGETTAMTSSTQNKDFFSAKYSLKAKCGGFSKGQELYCIPLTARGIYELPCHQVLAKIPGEQGFKGFYNTYILCHGFDETSGETTDGATCCQLALEEWNKYNEAQKKGIERNALIRTRKGRVYLPILLLGNDVKTKTAGPVPLTKLNMSGREFCYLEFSDSGFKTLMTQFENDLINNGRIAYELEGEEKYNAILAQMQKHIMKISITESTFNPKAHNKVFSFISFENKNIGAETGAYRQITEGLEKAPKLKQEVEEFLTLFETELTGVLTPWKDVDLVAYVHGTETMTAQQYQATGTPAVQHQAPLPKAEQQVVIEDDGETVFGSNTSTLELDDDESDDDLFDSGDNSGGDISLDDSSIMPSNPVDIPEDDSSFSLEDDEDFFGE